MTVAYDDRLELDVPGCYPFMDGATQKIRDFSGKARHGTVTNFAGTDVEYEDVTGLGQCINISTPKYVNHGQILNYTVENFSFEFVFNTNYLGALSRTLFYKGNWNANGYYIYIVSGAIIVYTNQLAANQSTASVANDILIGPYYHIIVSRSGPSIRIFKNGSETTYAAVGVHINPANSLDDLYVGRFLAVPASDFNGRILRYRSWSRAIGAAEAAEKYQAWVMGR